MVDVVAAPVSAGFVDLDERDEDDGVDALVVVNVAGFLDNFGRVVIVLGGSVSLLFLLLLRGLNLSLMLPLLFIVATAVLARWTLLGERAATAGRSFRAYTDRIAFFLAGLPAIALLVNGLAAVHCFLLVGRLPRTWHWLHPPSAAFELHIRLGELLLVLAIPGIFLFVGFVLGLLSCRVPRAQLAAPLLLALTSTTAWLALATDPFDLVSWFFS